MAPMVYDMNASIYIWRRKSLLKKNNLFFGKTSLYLMKNEYSIDVDTKEDFEIIKKLI